ncbi:MAG TPA: MOSC domain-containing protein [Gaiellaceae bacterium]
MFGSPSGALFDLAGALAGGGTIEEGWLVARLDLRLPIDEPWGSEAGVGVVEGLLVAPDAEAPLARLKSVEAIAGRGLDGDRYANGRGTFSTTGRGYELTLVEAEVLDSVDLSWEQARRNIVTRGVSLNALVGRRFAVGSVECIGRRLAEPCSHLEKLARPGLLRPLVHRAGLRADIIVGGTITVGDEISAAD